MPKGLCDSLGFSGVSTLSGAHLERMMAERASGQTGLWRGLSSRRGRDRWRPADAASGGRYRSPNERPPRLTRVRVRKEMPDGFSANVTFGGHYLSPVPVFKIDGPEAVAYSTAASPTKMGTLKGVGFPRVADERPRLGWFDSRERLLAGPANRLAKRVRLPATDRSSASLHRLDTGQVVGDHCSPCCARALFTPRGGQLPRPPAF